MIKTLADGARGLNSHIRRVTVSRYLTGTFKVGDILFASRLNIELLVLMIDQIKQSTQESYDGPGNSTAR
jgi:hypothetical protein